MLTATLNEISASSAASETGYSLAHKWSMRSYFCKNNLDFATKKKQIFVPDAQTGFAVAAMTTVLVKKRPFLDAHVAQDQDI